MKTAIDWLVEQLTPSIALQQKYIDEIKEQAKQKEKEQIADAFRNGSTSSMLGGGHWTQYYNQTYNQNK